MWCDRRLDGPDANRTDKGPQPGNDGRTTLACTHTRQHDGRLPRQGGERSRTARHATARARVLVVRCGFRRVAVPAVCLARACALVVCGAFRRVPIPAVSFARACALVVCGGFRRVPIPAVCLCSPRVHGHLRPCTPRARASLVGKCAPRTKARARRGCRPPAHDSYVSRARLLSLSPRRARHCGDAEKAGQNEKPREEKNSTILMWPGTTKSEMN